MGNIQKTILNLLNEEGFVVVEADEYNDLYILQNPGDEDTSTTLMTIHNDWVSEFEEGELMTLLRACAYRALSKYDLRTLELSYIQDEFDEVFLSIRAIWF